MVSEPRSSPGRTPGGFELPAFTGEWLDGIVGRPGWHCYLALDGDEACRVCHLVRRRRHRLARGRGSASAVPRPGAPERAPRRTDSRRSRARRQDPRHRDRRPEPRAVRASRTATSCEAASSRLVRPTYGPHRAEPPMSGTRRLVDSVRVRPKSEPPRTPPIERTAKTWLLASTSHPARSPRRRTTMWSAGSSRRRRSPAGRLYHVALETDGQIQVFDIWDSQESFEASGNAGADHGGARGGSRPATGLPGTQHHRGLSLNSRGSLQLAGAPTPRNALAASSSRPRVKSTIVITRRSRPPLTTIRASRGTTSRTSRGHTRRCRPRDPPRRDSWRSGSPRGLPPRSRTTRNRSLRPRRRSVTAEELGDSSRTVCVVHRELPLHPRTDDGNIAASVRAEATTARRLSRLPA